MKIQAYILTYLTFLSLLSFSQKAVYTSVTSGNWDVPATWGETTKTPTKNDDAIIVSPHTVTIVANTQITELTINEGGTLAGAFDFSFKNNSFMSISGTMSVASLALGTASATCAVSLTGVLNLTGNLSLGSGTLTIDGIADVGAILNNDGTISGLGEMTAIDYDQTGTGTIFGIDMSATVDGTTYCGSTWLGNTASTSWTTGTNWVSGSAPSSTSAISILSGTGDAPAIVGSQTVKRLNIGSGTSVTIASTGDLTVSEEIVNDAGTSGLIIQSSITSSGSLIYTSGTPNGTVQRYLTDNSWHTVTPSTEGCVSGDFYFSDAPESWLTYHTESTNAWTYIFSLTYPLPVGQGYAVWLDDLTDSDDIAIMEGALRPSDLSVTLEYSGSGSTQGWNLIGNPFTSAIDKDLGTWGTNITGTVYVWVNGDNDYRYYNTVGGGTLAGGIIPISQGFFVQATSAGAFTIPAAARAHSTSFYKNTEKDVKPFVRFDLTAENNLTVAYVGFPEGGTSGFDINMDANRLYGSYETPQMIIPEGSNNLCIKAGSPLVYNVERIVPLNIEYFIDGNYELVISDLDHLPYVQITLEDLITGTSHNFNANDTYQFTANEGDDPERFLLHFLSTNSSVNDPLLSADDNMNIYSWDKKIYIKSKGEAIDQSGTVEIFDVLGRSLLRQNIEAQEQIIISVPDLCNFLFVRVVKENVIKTQKVFIK